MVRSDGVQPEKNNLVVTDEASGNEKKKILLRAEFFTAGSIEGELAELKDLKFGSHGVGFLVAPLLMRCKFQSFELKGEQYWKLIFFVRTKFEQVLFVRFFERQGSADLEDQKDDTFDLLIQKEWLAGLKSLDPFKDVHTCGQFCVIKDDTDELLNLASNFVRGSSTISEKDFVPNESVKVFTSGEGAIVVAPDMDRVGARRALLIYGLALAYCRALDNAAMRLSACCDEEHSETLNKLMEEASRFYGSSFFRFPVVAHNIVVRPLWPLFFNGLSIQEYSEELIHQLNLVYQISNQNDKARSFREREDERKRQDERDKRYQCFGYVIGGGTLLQLILDIYNSFFK